MSARLVNSQKTIKHLLVAFSVCLTSISVVYADESADIVKTQALQQIESVFSAEQRYMTFSKSDATTQFPTPITTTLITNWDFVIFNIKIASNSSKLANKQESTALSTVSLPAVPEITLERVAITVDGITIAKPMQLTLQPKIENKYYFADSKLNNYIRI